MIVKIRDFIRKYNMLTFYIGLIIVGVVFTVAGAISISKKS